MPFEQKGQTMTLTTDNPQHSEINATKETDPDILRRMIKNERDLAAEIQSKLMEENDRLRAQHEALIAAAKALKRYHHPPSIIDAPDCPCCNCEGERAIAALRAAGILEESFERCSQPHVTGDTGGDW